MQANSFSVKRLRVTFILAASGQVFPGTNSNTLILTGNRIQAQVQGVARQTTQAALRVYGMKKSDMEALTVVWANPPVVLDHVMIVEADNGNGFSQVFKGTIIEAQPEYRAQPDTYFSVLASTGYFQKVEPAEPTAYTETTDIGLVAGDLAQKMGFTFRNGGIDTVLNGPLYLHGTLYDQLATACEMANADFYLLGDTILITPAGRPDSEQPAVILNESTGLIGYPVYERSGLQVQALFNPAFLNGTPVEITSETPNATGRWYPYSMTHVLEANTPKGRWQTNMQCLRVFT
jgi:hypothetical protein